MTVLQCGTEQSQQTLHFTRLTLHNDRKISNQSAATKLSSQNTQDYELRWLTKTACSKTVARNKRSTACEQCLTVHSAQEKVISERKHLSHLYRISHIHDLSSVLLILMHSMTNDDIMYSYGPISGTNWHQFSLICKNSSSSKIIHIQAQYTILLHSAQVHDVH